MHCTALTRVWLAAVIYYWSIAIAIAAAEGEENILEESPDNKKVSKESKKSLLGKLFIRFSDQLLCLGQETAASADEVFLDWDFKESQETQMDGT